MSPQRAANNIKQLRDRMRGDGDDPAVIALLEQAYTLLAPQRPIDLPELQAERGALRTRLAEADRARNPKRLSSEERQEIDARLEALTTQIAPLEALRRH